MHGLFAALALGLFAIKFTQAALPPDVVEELKADATEKLYLKIMRVGFISSENCVEKVAVEATVTGVRESEFGMEEGDPIYFRSYVIHHDTPECENWVGPQEPPSLFPGNCFSVYMNKSTEHPGWFELAAYGHSFEPSNCEEPYDIVGCDDGELLVEVNLPSSTGTDELTDYRFCCGVGGPQDDVTFTFDDCYLLDE